MNEYSFAFRQALELNEYKEMTEQQVLDFANRAKFKISAENLKSRCVDGRYEGMDTFPAIAKPGGDAGDVLIAFGALNKLGVSLPHEDVVSSVIKAVGGEANFCFHTDEHAVHDDQPDGMGCGHIKLAKNNSEKYLISGQQAEFLFGVLPQLIEKGADQVVLKGDHKESAVVVVSSEEYSIKPMLRDEDKIEEVFVYQKTLHEQQLLQLSKVLQENLAATGVVTELQNIEKAIEEVFAVQLSNTLASLAAGLPVFTIKFDEMGNAEIA